MYSSGLHVPNCPPTASFSLPLHSNMAFPSVKLLKNLQAYALLSKSKHSWNKNKKSVTYKNSLLSKILVYFSMPHCCKLPFKSKMRWDLEQLWGSSVKGLDLSGKLSFCFPSSQWIEFENRGWILEEIYKHICVFGVMYSAGIMRRWRLPSRPTGDSILFAPSFSLLSALPLRLLQLCLLCSLHSLMTG